MNRQVNDDCLWMVNKMSNIADENRKTGQGRNQQKGMIYWMDE